MKYSSSIDVLVSNYLPNRTLSLISVEDSETTTLYDTPLTSLSFKRKTESLDNLPLRPDRRTRLKTEIGSYPVLDTDPLTKVHGDVIHELLAAATAKAPAVLNQLNPLVNAQACTTRYPRITKAINDSLSATDYTSSLRNSRIG